MRVRGKGKKDRTLRSIVIKLKICYPASSAFRFYNTGMQHSHSMLLHLLRLTSPPKEQHYCRVHNKHVIKSPHRAYDASHVVHYIYCDNASASALADPSKEQHRCNLHRQYRKNTKYEQSAVHSMRYSTQIVTLGFGAY